MNSAPEKITLAAWENRYRELKEAGLEEPSYGGPLSRDYEDGDTRLACLMFDNSVAALRLWKFLLTEEERLREARAQGMKLIGTMKDLGTAPVMAYALPDLRAFYPDGAWWIPCIMELNAGLLAEADSLGINEAFCPARAMLGAFVTENHFPLPDFLTCSVGAICDDFSAIAQRLNSLGHEILWWEVPARRLPEPDEESVELPGGFAAPRVQVDYVKCELERVRKAFGACSAEELDDDRLREGIREANRVRRVLNQLRHAVYKAPVCPLPALEMLIAEMLAIHFCSDREESRIVLEGLLEEVEARLAKGVGVLPESAVRVYWVNPVADLRAMNLLESCGGRICGTDYMFCHALDEIPEDLEPMEALARIALADPMVGSAKDRAARICRDAKRFGAQAVIVSSIPGASHCATEGGIVHHAVQDQLQIPVIELEVPPLTDSMMSTLRTRIEGLLETVIHGQTA